MNMKTLVAIQLPVRELLIFSSPFFLSCLGLQVLGGPSNPTHTRTNSPPSPAAYLAASWPLEPAH